MEVYRVFMQHVEDKNPSGPSGNTPLHLAARAGKFELCRLILQNVREKNPKNDKGVTPLDEASESKSTACHFLFLSLKS